MTTMPHWESDQHCSGGYEHLLLPPPEYVFVFDGKVIRGREELRHCRSRHTLPTTVYALSNSNTNNSNPPETGVAHLDPQLPFVRVGQDPLPDMRGRSTSDPHYQRLSTTATTTGNQGPPDTVGSPHATGPRYHYHRQRAGVYGWRKRCLYFSVAALTSLLLLNLGLTIWMIRLLRFTWRGMGNVRIMPDGVIMNGRTAFNRELRISEIRPSRDGNLRLVSDRSVILKAQDSGGNVANQLYVGPNGFISQGPRFQVKNKFGNTLFEVTPDNMTVKMNTLHINGRNGAKFRESVETPFVRSPPAHSLKLESLTRSLEIEASGVDMKALAGEINALSLQDVVLNSRQGHIKLEGPVYLPDLPTAVPNLGPGFSGGGGTGLRPDPGYRGIFQLCLCESGRLFLALPDSNCRGVYDICSVPV